MFEEVKIDAEEKRTAFYEKCGLPIRSMPEWPASRLLEPRHPNPMPMVNAAIPCFRPGQP